MITDKEKEKAGLEDSTNADLSIVPTPMNVLVTITEVLFLLKIDYHHRD